MATEGQQEPKKKQHRSPAYPYIDLEDAVGKARIVWDKERKNPTTAEIFGSHWDYAKGSSAVALIVSAMRQYGLIEGKGTQVRLTDLAVKIMFSDEGSEEKKLALQQAFLGPQLYKNLWDKYNLDLPSNESLKNYMVRDGGYNDKMVSILISNYKKSLDFASMKDYSGSLDGNVETTQNSEKIIGGTMVGSMSLPASVTVAAKQRQFNIPLSGNKFIQLVVPQINEADFAMFLGTLNLWKANLLSPEENKAE